MNRMLQLACAALILPPIVGISHAESWNCRNQAVEISCGEGECTVSRDHTPMAVTISLSGDMSFCAYSGCWQGSATDILATGQYLTVTGTRLRWTGTGAASGESIAGSATVDRKSRTATVMIAGFAHPMTCERNPAGG